MLTATFGLVCAGLGLAWFTDAGLRQEAKPSEQRTVVVLLSLTFLLAAVRKLDLFNFMLSDWMYQWLIPWMQGYLTGGS
ncbi:hypothetical protein [Ammoniphilus oxalaticus]|nr:hypothetical protein [Ammoniphilus oxalaticus]